MDLIIKNARIVTGDQQFSGAIGIKGEKIVKLAPEITEPAREVIEAEGKLVLPAALDVHTHFALPVNGAVSGDDFESGTKAAALGGVTTIIDFVTQQKGEDLFYALEKRKAEAENKAFIDYSFHISPTDYSPKTWAAIPELVKQGFPSFKVYLAYRKRGLMTKDRELFKLLELAGDCKALVLVHAENDGMIEDLTQKYVLAGKLSPLYHARSRPNLVEAEAVGRAIKWAEAAGAQLYFVHISTKEALAEIISARSKGLPIYGETSPNYLLLTEAKYRQQDGYLYVLTPPLRTALDREALWQALKNGVLQVIATDHCPFQKAEKAKGKADFRKIPNGLPGVETTMRLLYSEGVLKGRISLNQMVSLLSYQPAKIFGLYPQKGTIAEGSDADLVIFDPEKEDTLSYKNLNMRVDYSPFEGLKLKGCPHFTFARGEVIVKEGKFIGKPGRGKLLYRKPADFPVAF